jgi:probable phosphoglycerate mutase
VSQLSAPLNWDQQVWLLRHGPTEWSESGKHTGTTDVPLTEKGEAAARAAGEVLKKETFALVLSSPLSRARRTAELAGFEPELDDDLHEWNYGEYEGRTTPEIREDRPDWTIWRDGPRGGEPIAAVAKRVDTVIARARGLPGDVLCFAHGHVLRVLAARWLALPPVDGRLFALGTAAVSVLGWERETPVVERWNEPAVDVGSRRNQKGA